MTAGAPFSDNCNHCRNSFTGRRLDFPVVYLGYWVWVMLLITCPQIKRKKSPLLLVFLEQFSGMAWALAMSITLLTKTNPQPSVWQPLHWTPSKNAPSSEYFGRFAPIYDKIGTRNALSLELAFLFKDQSRRCCGKVMSQVCNFLFSWFTESVNKRYSLGSAERRTDLLSEGASGHFHCGWRFLD